LEKEFDRNNQNLFVDIEFHIRLSTIISENWNFSLRLGLAISHWETETTSFFFFIVLYISLIVIWRSFVTIYSNIAVKTRRRKEIKEKESSRTPTSWHVMSFSKKMLMTG